MRRTFAALALAFFFVGFVAMGALRASPPDEPVPDDILKILDLIKVGGTPTEGEMKKLGDYALRERDKPGDGQDWKDVQAIIAKLKKGEKPTDAEIAKMKKFGADMKGREGQLRKDAEDMKKKLEEIKKKAPSSGKKRKQDLDEGTIHLDVKTTTEEDREYGPDSGLRGHSFSNFTASYPVNWIVQGEGPSESLSIQWFPSDKKPVTGSVQLDLYTYKKGWVVDTAVGGFAFSETIAQGAQTQGELVAAKGKRPFLHVLATSGAKGHVSGRHRDSEGKDEDKSGDMGAMTAMAALSLDGINEDSTLTRSGLPPKSMAEMRKLALEKIPAAMKNAAKGATCSFDAALFRKLRAAGEAFKIPVKYHYRLLLDKEEEDMKQRGFVDVNVAMELEFGELGSSELEIVPADDDDPKKSLETYNNWLPRPYTTDQKVADAFKIKTEDESVAVTFKVQFKEAGRKGPIEVELWDLSENKGVCVNYPPRDAKPEKGLRFIEVETEKDLVVTDEKVTTKNDVSSVRVKVVARESGAYGRLLARSPGSGTGDAIFEETKKPFARIPRDDDDNKIADAWSKEKHSEMWDEDPQNGQRRPGDGYTFYEEYRGFIVTQGTTDDTQWKHVRTDPKKKDIFIYDKDELIRRYYEPHNKEAANLELHYVTPDLFWFDRSVGSNPAYLAKPDPDNRRVNVNSDPEHMYARQYAAVVLVDNSVANGKGQPIEGATGSNLPGDQTNRGRGVFEQPLKFIGSMRINLREAEGRIAKYESSDRMKGHTLSPEQHKAAVKNFVHGLVVHEFGHQIGIHHHFTEHAKVKYNEKGEITYWPEPDEGEDAQGPISGVMDCAMRYQGRYEDLKVLQTGKWELLTRYCRNGDLATDMKGHHYDTADGCWHQIDVKSDP